MTALEPVRELVRIMAIKIGHASIDEHGKISGGKSGDQTRKEICVRPWYPKPWNVYLECTDKELANCAASIMEEICADDNYGYDQVDRWTGYQAILKNKNKVKGAKGEFDCSSLIITCYILAGLSISSDGYTGNLKEKLLRTGKFKAYMDKAYLSTDKNMVRGGVLLREGSHTAMALENGSSRVNPYPEPKETILLGSKGENVKWVQWELRDSGITEIVVDGEKKPKKLTIDGDCGKITDAAIRYFQDKHRLEVDGKVGPKTINALKK